MEKGEFSKIRHFLGKTQRQMAELLGISVKAIQSFEQGWRNIPTHVERQVLFLLINKANADRKVKNCWSIEKCPRKIRAQCPAFEFGIGHLCWFINGTICKGRVQNSWTEKMALCRNCKVFTTLLPKALDDCEPS